MIQKLCALIPFRGGCIFCACDVFCSSPCGCVPDVGSQKRDDPLLRCVFAFAVTWCVVGSILCWCVQRHQNADNNNKGSSQGLCWVQCFEHARQLQTVTWPKSVGWDQFDERSLSYDHLVERTWPRSLGCECLSEASWIRALD